jgi:hypothetical protein
MSPSSSILCETRSWLEAKPGLAILAALQSAITCLSLIQVANYQSYMPFDHDRMWIAITVAVAFSVVSMLFVFARFSFGYFVGFYLYTMILGFLWINVSSKYNYDHRLAGISAAASLVLFLMPTLFVTAPARQILILSEQRFERLLNLALIASAAVIATAATHNFRLASLAHIYDFRGEVVLPGPLRYLVGIVSSVLLPFLFACYWLRGYRWRAVLVLVLLLLFYPITLTKFALFSPAWLIVLVVLSRLVEARSLVILSVLGPMLVGIVAIVLTHTELGSPVGKYFDVVNIRMMATPSSALDIYNHFFASHPLTWFCQISVLKAVMPCAYQDPLSVVMQNTYGFGNLNASLFATEGIASVGPYLAPLTALISGFVLAIGNRVSAGLPSRFVIVSGGALPQVLLNVPLTVALLSHGLMFLFLLWYLAPRSFFDEKS